MYFSLQCKPALKNVLQLTIIFAWIVLVLGCSEKEFNCKDYDAAAHHLQARGEGAYDLPAEMKELSVTHQAYITQHEEQGRLILFVLWRGRTHNLRGALRVSDDFDVDEIERNQEIEGLAPISPNMLIIVYNFRSREIGCLSPIPGTSAREKGVKTGYRQPFS